MTKKIILITGGSKGIGLEAVRRFSRKGDQVITCSRNPENWNAVVNAQPELSNVDFQRIDISNREQVTDFFEYIRREYGYLDVSVNNASPKIESQGIFSEVSIDKLLNTVTNDFWGHVMCLKHELKLTRKGGSIVNVSSINGFRPLANAAVYAAAKHGIEGLTRSVALEAIKDGIRINSVAPGVTWTPRWQERIEDGKIDSREPIEKQVPINRFAQPKEVVNAIEWLSSDQASYVVGHTLVVDGGLSLI
jgi:NAD(P)-dependent dehydrogenase (short-subunit alcohol dehydrogenase family)